MTVKKDGKIWIAGIDDPFAGHERAGIPAEPQTP